MHITSREILRAHSRNNGRGRAAHVTAARSSSGAPVFARKFDCRRRRSIPRKFGARGDRHRRSRTHARARAKTRTGGGVPTAAAAVLCAHSADISERQRRRRRRRYRYVVRPHATRWVPSKTSGRPRHTSAAGAGDKTDAKKQQNEFRKKRNRELLFIRDK